MNLADKHRPQSLDDVAGQADAVAQIRTVLARGWGGRAWWITGPSGCGKSTLARIIAALGADELGVEEIDSQTLTPAKLRDIEGEMQYRMLGLKTGKAYIVNEAHGLRKDTIRQLLVVLERLPEHCCWIFTTTATGQAGLFENDVSGDAAPLLSRCIEVTLQPGGKAFAERAKRVAMAEGIDGLPLSVYEAAVAASNGNLRRVLQRIESGAFRRDAVQAMQAQLVALQRDYGFVASTKGPEAARSREAITQAMAGLKACIAGL